MPAATRWPSRTKTASTVPVAGEVTVVVAAACTVAGASTTSLTVDRPTAATWMPDELPVHPVSSTALTATAAVAPLRGSLTGPS